MIKGKLASCLIFVAMLALISPSLSLAKEGKGLGPFSFDGDLRNLPKTDPNALRYLELPPPAPLLPGHTPGGPKGGPTDPLIQLYQPFEILSPILGFPGTDNFGNPPDTNGVVGPDHYIQTVNVSFNIWDKTGGHLVGPTNFTTLFNADTPTGTPCDNGFTSDPVVLYDPQADRFILTILAFAGFQPPPAPPRTPIPPFYECIAVSKTSNPVTGGWHKYALLAHNTDLNDFPKLGVWPDAYYMSANMNGCCGGGTYVIVWALDKSSILGGGALNEQHFVVPAGYNSLLPSNMHGTPPPAGEPNVFAAIDYNNNNVIYLWNFHVDWAVPANSTFGGAGHIPDHTVTVAPYTHLTAAIPQPGTTTVFHDALGDRLNYPAQYRNIAGTESLWLDHPVDTGGNVSGIRWYEVRDPSGAPTLFQQGTWNNGGDSVNRWMGGIAADRFGNMAVGYNVSSSTVSPGIRYAGRLVSDAVGTLGQGEGVLIDGSGNYLNCTPNAQCKGAGDPDPCCSGVGTGTCTCSGRWGDYSGMSVDPVDDCTFWFTGEYVSGGNAHTRIGNFLLPGCDADVRVTKTGPSTVTVGSNLPYTITVSNAGPVAAQFVTLTDAIPPGTTFVSFTQNTGPAFTCTTPSVGGTGSVDCSIAALDVGDSATFTLIVHVTADASGTITNTATVSAQELDPDTGNNTATVATIVIESADLQLTKLCKPDSPIPAGGTAACTITVTNFGPGEAQNVVVTDTVVSSGAFTFGTITTSAGTCSEADGVVTCNLGDMAVGAIVTIVVPVTANTQVDINDTATVTSSTPDPNPANNTASGAVHFVALADLGLQKSAAPSPVKAGNQLTYTLTVTNYGPSPAVNTVIKDTVPVGVDIVSVAGSGGASCNTGTPGDATKPTTCQYNTIASGGSETMTIVVNVLHNTRGILHNDASVSSATLDLNNINNLASTDTPIRQGGKK
jgi:uncharacterized repeat protein (TIGR01451 family)